MKFKGVWLSIIVLVSMTVAGLPAVGFGIHFHYAQDQTHEQPAPKETVSD